MDQQRTTQKISSGQLPDKQLAPGSILVNRYAIQEVIGLGGMGSVYRARDLHFPNVMKLVAVKEMINQARDPLVRQTIIRNFEREANILVTLNHPSIPQIFDYFTHNERSYLVLEFVQGKDLDELLNETTDFIPESRVLEWAIELCDVLSYLHEHKPEPIIFRDMKPSNVMVNQAGHIVLVDFGIAKSFRSGQKGTMIGTEGYSPPEQYRGEASQAADIYALGATLHHLVTHKDPRLEPPFTFADRVIRQINPSISAEFESVINTALQYSPADRFPSAKVMKEALVAAARKTGLLLRRGAGASGVLKNDGIKPVWTFKCEDEIRSSPFIDKGVVYVGAYDNNLYALNAADGNFLWKYPTGGGIVSRPAVSDTTLLFGSSDSRLYAVSAISGKLSWAFEAEAAIHTSPAVSNGRLVFGSDDGMLYSLDLDTNQLVWRYDTGSPIRSSPVVNEDLIYFGTDYGDFFCLGWNGQPRWRSKAKRAIACSPLLEKGTIFFTSYDGILYALDARSGWAVWRFRMGKGSVSSPCSVDNYVIAGSADCHIYCVDIASSREVWRFKADHQVSGSPVIYNDAVYCGTADGTLYCLEFRTGRQKWKFHAGGPITSSPIVYNNMLYVGSADHILYALLT